MRVKLGGTTRAGNLGIDTVLRNLRCAQDAKADRVLRSSVSLAACDAGEVKSDARKIGGGLCGDHRGFVVHELSRQGLSATLEEHATKVAPARALRFRKPFRHSSVHLCAGAGSLCLWLRRGDTGSPAEPASRTAPPPGEKIHGATVRTVFWSVKHVGQYLRSHCMQAVWQCALNLRGVRSYREVATDVATIASLGCVLNRAEHRMLTV